MGLRHVGRGHSMGRLLRLARLPPLPAFRDRLSRRAGAPAGKASRPAASGRVANPGCLFPLAGFSSVPPCHGMRGTRMARQRTPKGGTSANADSELARFLKAHPDVTQVDAFLADMNGVPRGKRFPVHEAGKIWSG